MSTQELSKTVNLEGLAELEAGFAKLEAYAYSSVMKKALKLGPEIVVEEARSLVPVKSGATRNAIRVRAGRSNRTSFSFFASVGKRFFVGDEFYGAFLEFGWKHGGRKGRKAANRKSIAGEHYLEYAFYEKASEASRVILESMKQGLEQELKN